MHDCLVTATKECPFHSQVRPGYGLPDREVCRFREVRHTGSVCGGVESKQCPLNVWGEIRVRRGER